MRVKRLEIQGFKSFKDKTVIHFDHSITGIVGPNGCGKSNIVDAFFWVMGEQSYKHMRGSSSGDLIFNGSSRYSPLGMAEATLVLETDVVDTENAPAGASARDLPVHLRTKEISVTRRLYRGGEGEYFINGVPARLKDIHELFMDTGVGAKGYSVIEQGQIGKIVNAKPEDRRLLIEEAAGIAKYKARKKESLRKIEATQANLSRLNDVIQEIERNLASLERQAQKARQYKKYKDELLDKEMTWGRRKSQVLRQRLDIVKKERDALEQELAGLKAELQVAENSIETDRVEQLTNTKAAEELQSRIQELSSELTREQSALELSRKRQGDLASQLQALQNEKEELQRIIEAEQAALAEKEDEARQAEETFRDSAERVRTMDGIARAERSSAEEARRELDQAKRNLMNSIAQASDFNSRSASLLTRIESARVQAVRLRQQAEAQRDKVASAREEADRIQESARQVSAQREALQAEKHQQVSLVQEREQDLRQADRARDEAAKKLTQIRSKLQSLEELAAAYEGFGNGPKAALDWARESGNAGKFGAISDLYRVTAGFEAALEGWLEGKLENLFSTDSTVASQALERIQTEKQGRAAIHLPADGRELQAEQDQEAVAAELASSGFEVIGPLKNFIEIESEDEASARNILAPLVSRVLVVESFANVSAFIQSGGILKLNGWAVVSRDGQALDSDGVLRGGSTGSGDAASVLGRKRVIADLRDQVAAAESEHDRLEQEANEARQALELARGRLQSIQSELQELEIQHAALARDVHSATRSLKDAESQLELLELEATEMEQQSASAQAEREEIEAKVNEIVSKRSEMETGITEGEALVAAREAEVRSKEEELNALRVEEASLRERSSSLNRELQSIRSMLADRQRRLAEIERVLDRATRERDQHTGGDQGLEERIEELTRTLDEARARLSEIKDQLEQANAKLNASLSRIKELHATGDAKTSQTNQMALEIEKLSGELAHLVQNLEEKYGPGCLERPVTSPIQEEMSEPVVTHEMSAEEEKLLGEEVERLRERIRRLGEVNVMAIEEFEEAKKRHDYLLNERGDLEKSIENLQEAIEHINKTSEERFRRAFEAVRDRFERLFPIIFGGGQAKLSLIYPEGSTDILEAGVDILAQPPGKKVQNIQLLSGGEKALTAVSLIFAIFMVKPSPFCVLDEVDAPLDDANIGKFNALLREMSAKSQFIVITHNKKTMELNDTLYGVTMEEPGVSKMVSIEIQ